VNALNLRKTVTFTLKKWKLRVLQLTDKQCNIFIDNITTERVKLNLLAILLEMINLLVP